MEGARSREQEGSREDRGFVSEPKENFDKHNRACDDHSALFHVIWESMGRFLSQLEASPFLFRFQNVSLSYFYRFFLCVFFFVSLPFSSSFLPCTHFRFFRFFSTKQPMKKRSQRFF